MIPDPNETDLERMARIRQNLDAALGRTPGNVILLDMNWLWLRLFAAEFSDVVKKEIAP